MKYSLGISDFLEEISSLSHPIVFLYFFALIAEEGFLISPCYARTLHSDIYLSLSPLPFASLLLLTSLPFLSFIEPIFAWHVPLVSLIFLKTLLVFPVVLFPSISLHCSLRKAVLSLLEILWDSAFSGYSFLYSFCPLLGVRMSSWLQIWKVF